MIYRFFNRFKKEPCVARRYIVPEGVRVYAVGDVHGRDDLLRPLHSRIMADAARFGGRTVVVYLGDYVDRGSGVKETVEEVIEGLPSSFEKVYLMGNHEEMLLDFLKDPSVYELWTGLGGTATLLSYGVLAGYGQASGRKHADVLRRKLIEAIGEKHLRFFRSLEYFCQIGDYLFVHAGIRPGTGIEKQHAGDLLWIREDFLRSGRNHGVRVVHGHTVSEKVQDHPNRLGLDTGAYATGVLTCAVLESDTVRMI